MIKFPEKLKLTTLSLSDPLTKETETKRMHLMFVACASILLTVYGLKLNKTPWLDIEVPSGAPNILHGALSVALVYTFLVFLIHAWTDITRWWIARESIELQGYNQLLIQLQNHLNGMHRLLNEPSSHSNYTEQQKVQAQHSQSQASAHLVSLQKELYQLQKRHSVLTTLQFARIGLFDIGTPALIAAIAFSKISHAIGPFLAAIIK
jgi:hypothetical protein